MKKLVNSRSWLILLALPLLFLWPAASKPQGNADAHRFSLRVPSFVRAVNAAADNAAIETIQSEGGISAYFQSTTSVSISSVRSVYQTIELETANYILGTVALSGYPENHAPHVYVHTDGWFLAYYLDTDPVSKIIDWNAYTASGDTTISTKLENILAVVAGAAGVGIPGITHYDFRYPNANTFMVIAERDQGTNNNYFTINIPTSFGVSERSFYTWDDDAGGLSLNGTNLAGGSGHRFGTISASQMPPATTHTIIVWDGTEAVGGIALVYTE